MNGMITVRSRISLLAAGIVAVGLFAGWHWHQVQQAQTFAPDRLIRFHVIANSDTAADQALKLRVRDVIVGAMAPRFRQAADIDEARQIARENLGYMQRLALAEVRREGKNYPVEVYLGHFHFPAKTYHLAAAGNPWEKPTLTLPAGTYEAVRVVIGRGAGHNWWCVLFPPLCFVDVPAGQPVPPPAPPAAGGAVQGGGPAAGSGGETAISGAGDDGAEKPREERPDVPAFKLSGPPAVTARSGGSAAVDIEFRWRIVDLLGNSSKWLARLFG